jgi:hypothetical protein
MQKQTSRGMTLAGLMLSEYAVCFRHGILERVDPDGLWLLAVIASISEDGRECAASNQLLCDKTRWSFSKLQREKGKLIQRGLLVVRPAVSRNGGRTANHYKLTDLV